MHAVRTFVVAALMATTGWTFTCGAERVDLLLILAADVSGSMDDSKFDLQRSGYAAAFSNPLRDRGHSRRPKGPHRHCIHRMVRHLAAEDRDRLDGDQQRRDGTSVQRSHFGGT